MFYKFIIILCLDYFVLSTILSYNKNSTLNESRTAEWCCVTASGSGFYDKYIIRPHACRFLAARIRRSGNGPWPTQVICKMVAINQLSGLLPACACAATLSAIKNYLLHNHRCRCDGLVVLLKMATAWPSCDRKAWFSAAAHNSRLLRYIYCVIELCEDLLKYNQATTKFISLFLYSFIVLSYDVQVGTYIDLQPMLQVGTDRLRGRRSLVLPVHPGLHLFKTSQY